MPRHTLRHLAHRVQRAARRAHDAVEVESIARLREPRLALRAQRRRAVAQLDVQPRQAVLQRACLGRAAHRLQQVVGHPGLEDVLVDAGFVDAGDDVFAVGVARDHDAHDVGPLFAHFLEEVHPGHAGHALVAQDHADRLALQQAARLVGAAGGEHREILVQRAPHRVL
jgi:hypothetical protein